MRKVILSLAVTVTLVLASPSHAATQTLVGVGFSFVSPVVVASGGDTVTLVAAVLPHTFTTAALICDGPLLVAIACNTEVNQGSIGSVTLQAAPGTYDFFCKIHQGLGMVGKLVVR